MEVICLEEAAFYTLLEQVFDRLKTLHGPERARWIDDVEAMRLMKITSKTTLQKLRDEGKIRYSQPQKRLIVYDQESILEYLDKHARNVF